VEEGKFVVSQVSATRQELVTLHRSEESYAELEGVALDLR